MSLSVSGHLIKAGSYTKTCPECYRIRAPSQLTPYLFVRGPTSLFRTKKYGRRPSAVVKAACLESQRSHSGLQILEKQNVSSYPTYTDSILWMPPWLRGSVLGLRPPWLEFWIQYLEAVSFHSSYHPHEVLLAQFSLYVHNGRWPKPLFISFHTKITTWMCNSACFIDLQRRLLCM